MVVSSSCSSWKDNNDRRSGTNDPTPPWRIKMEIALTQAQFIQLQKLIQIVKAAHNQETHSGEATNAVNSVEWGEDEVKFTLN